MGDEDVNRNPRCDTILCEAIQKKGIKLPKNDDNWRGFNQSDCYGYFDTLQRAEMKFITGLLKTDSLRRGMLSEYIFAFNHKELLDPDYDFDYDKPYQDKHIYGPIWLKTFVMLYNQRDFTAMKKLLYTKNVMFNWMVAEALLLYNKFENILSKKELKDVESYNGRNGFAKFLSEVKVLCGYYTRGIVPKNARW